uniref:Uncharacterized protein n=1 Tax=viral metagenome TaxID=1070528 RepID=A0A6C0AYU4_9ZZZZ
METISQSTPCSEELSKLYHDLELEPYNYENRSNFKKKVRQFEKILRNAKKEEDIYFTERQTDENKIERLTLMSKQLPDKPCIIEKSSLILKKGSSVTIIESETSSPEYFKEMFDRCKNDNYNRVIIPVTQKLYRYPYHSGCDTGKRHSNIIIVDLHTNEAWRIEPNDVDKENIEMYETKLTEFFNLFGITFKGFYPETCPINHGGLCKYVTYAQYLYGKEINYDKIKNVILQFLKDDILQLCKIENSDKIEQMFDNLKLEFGKSSYMIPFKLRSVETDIRYLSSKD